MSLQGNLSTLGIAEVLDLLGSRGSTGRLDVKTPGGSATFLLVEGQVSGSTYHFGNEAGDDAAYSAYLASGAQDGTFLFDEDHVPSSETPTESVSAVIERSAQISSAWENVLTRIGSTNQVVKRFESIDETVSIEPSWWSILDVVGSGSSIAAIAEASGQDLLSVAEAAANMIDATVLTVDHAEQREQLDENEQPGDASPPVEASPAVEVSPPVEVASDDAADKAAPPISFGSIGVPVDREPPAQPASIESWVIEQPVFGTQTVASIPSPSDSDVTDVTDVADVAAADAITDDAAVSEPSAEPEDFVDDVNLDERALGVADDSLSYNPGDLTGLREDILASEQTTSALDTTDHGLFEDLQGPPAEAVADAAESDHAVASPPLDAASLLSERAGGLRSLHPDRLGGNTSDDGRVPEFAPAEAEAAAEPLSATPGANEPTSVPQYDEEPMSVLQGDYEPISVLQDEYGVVGTVDSAAPAEAQEQADDLRDLVPEEDRGGVLRFLRRD